MPEPIGGELLSCLRSPETGQPLVFDDARRMLIDASTGREWPVIAGIPRFTSSQHLESFGRQWNRYEVAHDGEDRATFVAKTGIELSELRGLKVLDAGCGGGRYCKVSGEAGARVTGVDHTTAVEMAAKLCEHLPNVKFVQADLKHLPFDDESFDFVFSIGVMHHDVDTRAVFDAVARKVTRGGRYAVWLYRKNQWWQERINTAIRRRTTAMNPDQLERLCKLGAALGAIPLVNKTVNKVVNFSAHPDAQNRLCDTFDWWAPAYQHHHTTDEVVGWYRDAGFEEISVLPPEKTGRLYRWTYEKNLLIGSGVNVVGRRI